MSAGTGACRRKGAVVVGTPDRVRQHGPGLVDVAHPLGGVVRALVQVRMVALREASVGARHLQWRRVARDTEDGVRLEEAAAVHRADSTAAVGPTSV